MYVKVSHNCVLFLLQHPVLDEPIAEAVCIIADTDKWNVQVATSQRKMMDSMKLGKDVLVSSQVSSLLQSILQLYKLNIPADFVSISLLKAEANENCLAQIANTESCTLCCNINELMMQSCYDILKRIHATVQ